MGVILLPGDLVTESFEKLVFVVILCQMLRWIMDIRGLYKLYIVFIINIKNVHFMRQQSDFLKRPTLDNLTKVSVDHPVLGFKLVVTKSNIELKISGTLVLYQGTRRDLILVPKTEVLT